MSPTKTFVAAHLMTCLGPVAVWWVLSMKLAKWTLFLETHLGGGAIMKRKPPALRSIGIDLNRRAVERFSCGYPVELHHGCTFRRHSEMLEAVCRVSPACPCS